MSAFSFWILRSQATVLRSHVLARGVSLSQFWEMSFPLLPTSGWPANAGHRLSLRNSACLMTDKGSAISHAGRKQRRVALWDPAMLMRATADGAKLP
jgi:hypothetical protein